MAYSRRKQKVFYVLLLLIDNSMCTSIYRSNFTYEIEL